MLIEANNHSMKTNRSMFRLDGLLLQTMEATSILMLSFFQNYVHTHCILNKLLIMYVVLTYIWNYSEFGIQRSMQF